MIELTCTVTWDEPAVDTVGAFKTMDVPSELTELMAFTTPKPAKNTLMFVGIDPNPFPVIVTSSPLTPLEGVSKVTSGIVAKVKFTGVEDTLNAPNVRVSTTGRVPLSPEGTTTVVEIEGVPGQVKDANGVLVPPIVTEYSLCTQLAVKNPESVTVSAGYPVVGESVNAGVVMNVNVAAEPDATEATPY